ncbi:hypothetical protein JCM3765_001023 [Sporobolomyces pararoseus]
MDLLVVGVGIAAQRIKDKVAEFKSPIISLEPLDDRLTLLEGGGGTPLLTERVLYERHREWKMRGVSLWIRQTALIEAKARNFDQCWAGPVTRRTIKATKAAIVEAKWVERRLAEALEWCEEKEKTGKPLKKVIVQSKSGRPVHIGFPESLLELPFPLPAAPSSRNLRLTVPIPPSIEENFEGPPPPLYTPDLDEKSGEMRLENVRWDPVTIQEVTTP